MSQHLTVSRNLPAGPTAIPAQTALQALQSGEPQARALSGDGLAAELMIPLSQAAALLGHRHTLADPMDLLLLAQESAALIQRQFAAFNLAEIREAIRRGASGRYRAPGTRGDVLLVNLPGVGEWLQGYQAEARAAAVEQARKLAELPAGPPPPRAYVAELLSLYALAQAGRMPDAYTLDGSLYTWVKERGQFTNFRPAEYYADLRAEEAERVMRQPKSVNWQERRGQTSFAQACAAGNWPEGHPLANDVNRACRQRLLHEWLLQHAADETDLAALLAPFT